MSSIHTESECVEECPLYQLYVDGAWAEAAQREWFASENPSTGQPWAQIADGQLADIDRAVSAARRAFDEGEWPRMLPQERARILRRMADLAAERAPEIARIEAMDNGKLFAEHLLLWKLTSELLHYWAGMADKIGGETIQSPLPVDVRGTPLPQCFAYTRKEPVGVVAAITPWNSPTYLLAFKFGPAMAAGCTMVCKPSEHAPASTVEFARLVQEAGFPAGVFNVVTGQSRELGAYLVGHPDVDKVAFTGSTETGKSIVRSAAADLKRVSCELGGKSAAIVFDDADLDKAVEGVLAGVFAATGQTCMASSRLFVQEGVHDAFVQKLVAAAEAIKLGDPLEPTTTMGPLANRPNFEKVRSYLEVARQEGATFATGGRAQPDLGGYFIEPTVLTDVRNDMRVAQEEIFGPVASVIRFTDEDEAITTANDTIYGLAGAVFTENMARAHRVAQRVRTGTMWINTYRLVTHLAPFGGYKQSGWGREGGREGLEAYLETKSVWVPLE